MKSKNLAPIVLFVYNRPYHTKQTIEALQKNKLAKDSELFIYSDAPKNIEAKKSVDEVREFIKNIDGFKKVTVIEREKNWGLANSIIDGVTNIVNRYGKIIVLEDDLVTSPYFLKFMNEALEFYQNEKRVWHISAWNYPVNIDIKDDVFLWRVMNCWGWATWKDRWNFYEKDVDKIISTFSKQEIKRFNLDDTENFWAQVMGNKDGIINTWAIFWYATIFENSGLCLNPTRSFIKNIGLDGSGVHCGVQKSDNLELNLKKDIKYIRKIKENRKALNSIKKYYLSKKKSLFVRIINKLSRFFLKRNIL